MKNIITTALLVAVTASSAMAGHKPLNYEGTHDIKGKRSMDGYSVTYQQLEEAEIECWALGSVPLIGAACGAIALDIVKTDAVKAHMTYKWRKKVKDLAISNIVLSTFAPLGTEIGKMFYEVRKDLGDIPGLKAYAEAHPIENKKGAYAPGV